MPEFELVRWHCKGKPAHEAKAAHKPAGCAPVKAKAKGRKTLARPVRAAKK